MSEPFSLPELERVAREKAEYPRCATCKWCQPQSHLDGSAASLHRCLNPVVTLGGGGTFFVAIDFGCILHEVKA